jgi:hypothetical protein
MKSNPYRSLVAAITVAALAGVAAAHAQSDAPLQHSDTFAVQIAMQNRTLQVGQPPRLIKTVTNLTNHVIPVPGDGCIKDERLWVQGEHGEPPTTLRERDATGRLLPGEGSLQCSLVANMPPLAPGESTSRTFLLEFFYDFQVPGKYTAYLEVQSPEGWLRTNTVTFEIVAGDSPPARSNP